MIDLFGFIMTRMSAVGRRIIAEIIIFAFKRASYS